MSTGDTLPLFADAPAAPERRRRVWPWIVALIVVIALVIGGWFLAESIARSLVTSAIRGIVASNLDLPADQALEVELEGAVIPQLIGGSLDDVTIAAEDVALQGLSGDVRVRAQDIAVDGSAIGAATATVQLDEAELRALMAQVEGFPAESLGIAEPDVTISTELTLFGVAFPVGVSLTPSAAEGALVLTPASLQLAGADVTADELRRQFGLLSDAVLRDWPVCIAGSLPAGIVLTSVAVSGDELEARFDIAPSMLTDPALREPGTC